MTTVIAVDGPSASGKGTLARKLASELDFAYLDTGLLYRAVGIAVLSAGADITNSELAELAALSLAESLNANSLPHPFSSLHMNEVGKTEALLAAMDYKKLMEDVILRSDEASVAASKVASMPSVRAALMQFQKDFCATPPGGKKGAVVDGRDIGTVIAPDAALKFFVTASLEARTQRRLKELQGRGLQASYEAVFSDMKERDARDRERTIAPTKPAPDAVVLDTTHQNAAQALEIVRGLVADKLK